MRLTRRFSLLAVLAILFTGCASVHAAEQPSAADGPMRIPERFFNASTSGAGWFRREGVDYDLSELPTGRATLAGLQWHLPEGRAVMLAGAGSPVGARRIEGIRVGAEVEVLHFLHAFNPGSALRDWQERNRAGKAAGERPLEPPTLFRYVLHYADGREVPVNVRWNEGVNDWLRAGEYADPPYARTAWTQQLHNRYVHDRWPRKGERLALYAFRFENPRPAVAVESVDIVSANDRRHDWGAPAVFAISAAPREHPGTTYYVAPDGDDGAPGTFARPWATPYKAAETLEKGDTVYLRGGRYMVRRGWDEVIIARRSGTRLRPITYAAYPGETAVLDGKEHHCDHDRRVPYAIYDRDRGLFNVYDKTHLTVRNLRVENSRKSGFGVYDSRHVLMDHNTVYGTSHCAMNTSRNVNFRIIGNTLGQNCSPYYAWNHTTQEWTPWEPGTGEAPRAGREGIDNHGNEYTEIAFNEIYWCGKEGIADPGRHFTIHHNYIHDFIHTPETYWPAGIYLDAYGPIMDDLEVCANVIHDVATGVSIGSEGGTTATDIRVHHNLLYNMTWSGIGINSAGHNGLRENITIEHNTIYNCGHTEWEDGPTGGINVGTYMVRDITIRNNILSDNRDYHVSVHGEVDRVKRRVAVHHNLYDPVFLPAERIERRLIRWRPVIGGDLIIGDPQFRDPDAWDFRLESDSPAVDAAGPGTEDPDGTPADLGAFAHIFELPPPPPPGEGYVLRVNCGAQQDYTDQEGHVWKADPGVHGGPWEVAWSRTVTRDPREVKNTEKDPVYLNERYGVDRYGFDVPKGLYTVRLHFAETFHREPGRRDFDVLINGEYVLRGFDPARAAGGEVFTAVVREFETKAYRGQITIELQRRDKLINGIELIQHTAP